MRLSSVVVRHWGVSHAVLAEGSERTKWQRRRRFEAREVVAPPRVSAVRVGEGKREEEGEEDVLPTPRLKAVKMGVYAIR